MALTPTGQAAGLRPVTAQWQGTGTTDPDRAEATWTRRPFSVLLECGRGVDVLELPGRLAERAVLGLTAAGPACPVPVLLYPARWLLLTATGDGPIPEFLPWPGASYRGAGTWVPLPPTDLGQCRARWHTDPTELTGDLPETEQVQRVVAAAVRGGW
ncbi:MAG: bifunctional DNA primase/polymerase [Pseudonocardiaceae bacterium]